MNISDKIKNFEARLEEQEIRTLELEYRPLVAIKNFITIYPGLERGDRRKKAILFSLIYALFFSPGGVAAIGTIVGVATVCLVVWQSIIMRDSNELALRQIAATDRINQQQGRMESMRNLYRDDAPPLRAMALENIVSYGQSDPLSHDSLESMEIYFNDLVADISGGKKTKLDIADANLSRCELSKIYGNLIYRNVNFKEVVMKGLFHRSAFIDGEFGSAWIGGHFLGCEFIRTNWSDGIFMNPKFTTCLFSGTEFGEAANNIESVIFAGCWFIDLNITSESINHFLKAKFTDNCVVFGRENMNPETIDKIEQRGLKVTEGIPAVSAQ